VVTVIRVAGISVSASLILAIGSWQLTARGHVFAASLLLNTAAGFLVLGVGFALTAWLALILANEKLEKIARHLVSPIAQLRVDGAITGEAARRCVVCAVSMLSEKRLFESRSLGSNGTPQIDCGVCGLLAETEGTGTSLRCKYCKLKGDTWKADVRSVSAGPSKTQAV
jgi:hypothetical protein